MMIYWTFVLISSVVSEEIKDFSKPTLDLYIKYCGIRKTCNLDTDSKLKSFNQSVALQERCVTCICDLQHCTTTYHDDCCPDIILPRISTEDFEEWNLKHFSHYAIGSCRENANTTLNELCSKSWKDITDTKFYVVKDYRNVVYKNKYCALCNDIQEWTISNFVLTCKSPGFPLNLYSSAKALLSGASMYECRIHFQDRGHLSNFIDICNQTGLWNEENPEMEWACRYYATTPYSIFKNIFCYFCNTGLSPREPYIDRCILHEDALLENMCLLAPVDARFYPYKNQYCRKCNMLSPIAWHFSASFVFSDFESFETYDWTVHIRPDLCYLRHLELYKYLKISNVLDTLCHEKILSQDERDALQKEFDNVYQSSVVDRPTRFINITALYEEYHKFDGASSWCYPPNDRTICGCTIKCFNEGNCCPDMAFLSTEPECIDFASYSPSVFARCHSPKADKIMHYYCERDEEYYETILDFVPVYKGQVNYKNLFCMICSELEQFRIDETLLFWRVYVKCEVYIDIDNYIQHAKSFKELGRMCDIRLEPDDTMSLRETFQQPTKHQCSHNDDLHSSLSDMQYMCNWGGNFIYSHCKSKYKNIFCQMYEMHNEYINVSNELHFHPNYSFTCSETNDKEEKEIHSFYFYYPLKFVFNSVSSMLNKTKQSVTNCQSDEVYDVIYKKCRTIKCSPGKFFFDGKCVPVLDNVTGLGYRTEMIATVVTTNKGSNYSLQSVLHELLFQIYNDFDDNLQFFLITNITSVASHPCQTSWNEIKDVDKNYEVPLELRIESNDIVSRQELDEYLIGKMYNLYDIDVYGIIFRMRNSDRNLSNIWSQSHSDQYCYISSQCCSRNPPYYFEINELLVCPQITLENGEYEIINSRKLNIKRFGQNNYISYSYGLDGDLIACLSEYQSVNLVFSVSANHDSAFYFTVIISLLCLFFV